MVGNSIAYPDTAHNQSLPIATSVDLLAAQHHWFFWCFGPGAYQLLPIVTTSPHAVIGELGALETRSTKHYHCLPTEQSGHRPDVNRLYHIDLRPYT